MTKVKGSIAIQYELCKGCGICIEMCKKKVYGRDHLGKPVLENADECVACRVCEQHCPDFAIEITKEEVGE